MLQVIKFKTGEVVKESTKSPGWFTILCQQSRISINNGIPVIKNRIAALRVQKPMLDLLAPVEGMDMDARFKALGSEGLHIVRTESITPQFPGHQPKKNVKTGAVVTDAAGNPIYFADSVEEISKGLKDTFVASNKATAVTGIAAAAAAGEKGNHA